MELNSDVATDEHYKSILGQINDGNAMLFLGAGSTKCCRRLGEPSGLVGKGLAYEVLKDLNNNKPPDFNVSLMEACELYVGNKINARQGLDELIQKLLSGLQPTIGHYIAASLPWKAVVTTNYNEVVEQAWDHAHMSGFAKDQMNVIRKDADEENYDNKLGHIQLFKPHGCISIRNQHENQMILTSKDYFESEQKRKNIYGKINKLARSCSTIFVGYSMQDYTFQNMYYRLRSEFGDRLHQSFNIGTMSKQIKHPKYKQWLRESMAKNSKTTLITDTFDTFMLNLLSVSGDVHEKLKERILRDWKIIEEDNDKYLNGLSLDNIKILSEV